MRGRDQEEWQGMGMVGVCLVGVMGKLIWDGRGMSLGERYRG